MMLIELSCCLTLEDSGFKPSRPKEYLLLKMIQLEPTVMYCKSKITVVNC